MKKVFLPCVCYGEAVRSESFGPYVYVVSCGGVRNPDNNSIYEVIEVRPKNEVINEQSNKEEMARALFIFAGYIRAEVFMTGADDGTYDYFPGAWTAFASFCKIMDAKALFDETRDFVCRNHDTYGSDEVHLEDWDEAYVLDQTQEEYEDYDELLEESEDD